jgi:hypothetical protein
MTARRWVAFVFVLGVLTGCAGSPSANAPSTTTTTSTRMTDPSRCAVDQLTAAASGGDAGAGHRAFSVIMTNRSDSACTLVGFPGLTLFNGPTVVVDSVQRDPSGEAVPVVVPGRGRAYFSVRYAVIEQGDEQCPAIDGVVMTPPDTTQQLSVDLSGVQLTRLCALSGVQVTPIRSS